MGQQVVVAAKFQKLGNTLCFKAMKQGTFTLAPLTLWSSEFEVARGNPCWLWRCV